jgi:hypothetical protein
MIASLALPRNLARVVVSRPMCQDTWRQALHVVWLNVVSPLYRSICLTARYRANVPRGLTPRLTAACSRVARTMARR